MDLDGHLRQPSWKDLRPDLLPTAIHRVDVDDLVAAADRG